MKPTEKKYFGVRIPDSGAKEWHVVNWPEYDQGARCLRDLWQCTEHLRDKVYRYIQYRDYKKKGDLNADECGKYTYLRALPESLKSVISILNNIDRPAARSGSSRMPQAQLRDTRREKAQSKDLHEQDHAERTNAQEQIKRCQADLNVELRGLVKNIDVSINAYRWPTSGMKKEADDARKLIGDLVDQMPQIRGYKGTSM